MHGIKIESLKSYIGHITEEELIQFATKIYMITNFIVEDYPQYKEWYFTKQLPETIYGNRRNILFVRSPKDEQEIIAMACLKKEAGEQKLCTLYVSSQYRSLGIGTAMVEEAMHWLGTTRPFITFVDYKLEMFRSMIYKYDWELTDVVLGACPDRGQELCFNGVMVKNNEENLEQKLHKRFVKILKNRMIQKQDKNENR